jgi:hypothetical protein
MASWHRLVNELLEEAHVDKAVQTHVQDVLELLAEALKRADEVIVAKNAELARADEVIVAKNEVIVAKNAELARADEVIVKTEELYSMQFNAVHDELWMMHAVYMPRTLAATLLCALVPIAESQSIGSKEIKAFVDANVYEPGKGLGVPAGKRVFKPDALEALVSWSHSDVLSVHKAIEDLFKVWSTPHHVIVRNAQGSGSVIGANGEPVTTAEVIFFSVGMKQLERLRPDVRWPAALEVVRIITGKTAVGGIDFDSRTLGRSTIQTPAGVLCETRAQSVTVSAGTFLTA